MSAVDHQNLAFWNELCGSGLAREIGVSDDSPASLKKFDAWYFALYPYLFDHIPFAGMRDRRVLEIGLGYGTVAQHLMEAGAVYHGLDIAAGPVAMARHRAALIGANVDVRQDSVLQTPYTDGTFDDIVTIGCLHHTGDMAGALREVARVLRPGGRASIMLYNALSYRQWMHAPFATWRRAKTPQFNWANADPALRKAYDVNAEGGAAPSTTFISPREAKEFLANHFSSVTVTPRNIGSDFSPARLMPRNLARAAFESWLGLDLYIECVK